MAEELLVEELPSALAALIAEDDKKNPPAEPAKPEVDAAQVEPEAAKPEADPDVDPMVEKASKKGWTDKEAWIAAGKDPDEWVDAREFVARKPLLDKLKAQSKAIQKRDKQIEAVTSFAARAAQVEREKVLAEIAGEKKQAFEAGDFEAFSQAEKREREVVAQPEPIAQPETQQQTAQTPEIAPEVQDFAKRNEFWFEKDRAMTAFALDMASEYIQVKGMSRPDALKLVEADVRREFAHKFTNPNKDRPSAVAPNNREARGKTFGYNDLNSEQKSVWSSLKKVMTLDQYITDLRAQGELK